MPAYSVSGRLLHANGLPVSGAIITVYEFVDIETPEASRGFVTSRADGAYGPITWNQADVGSLFLVATDPTPPGAELARSALICPARVTPFVVDLVVAGEPYRGRSEFERVEQVLAPLISPLLPDAVPATALEWLACRSDIYPPHIAMYIQAHRLAGDPVVVAAATYYALLRAGLGPDKRSVLSTSRTALRAALEQAYERRILQTTSGTDEEAIDAAMEDLDEVVASAMMVEPSGGETNLRALLETSGLSGSLLQTFVELKVPFEGSVGEFWEAVHADPTLTGTPAEALEFTMEASVLVRSFLPALEGLQALRTATTISGVGDLAEWDVAEWLTFVGANGGAPADLPGETEAERRQFYAETMTRMVEERYPTQVLARRIERDTPTGTTGVFEFLDANPQFDVKHSVIPIYLDDNPPDPPLDPEVVANIKNVQRVWSLTPRVNRYNVAQVLLDGGITSAAQIVHGGAKAFTTAFATALDGVHPSFTGEELATQLYKNAVLKHTSAQVVLAQYAKAFNPIETIVVSPPAFLVTGSGAPTLAELMGSLDFCACEHCRSMLGPAAYFVDLLSRLEQTDAHELLETRRGDLRHIQLSCINTNTELPYIDIVNELLEHVANALGNTASMPARQTTWTAAELRQFPEHRSVLAYDGCAEAVYPWSLPMHLASVELGLYLQRLGVGREEMMRALQQPDETDPAPAAIVAEALGLTLFERDVITGAEPTDDIARPWNLTGGAGFSTALRADLRSVLDTVGLELDGLLRLLALRFIVPLDDQPAQWLVYPGGEPSCNLDEIDLDEAFDDDVASRLHRFVRLSRKTGLAWAELDTAVRLRGEERTPPSMVIDQQFLAELVDLLRLRARLDLELAAVAAISSRIETHSYEGAPSLYSRLFVSKANTDGAFDLVDEEVVGTPLLAPEHHDTIRAGIRVNAADLELLVASVLPEDPELSVATLSTLYAHATLARALRLRVPELLRLLALVGADPLASPAEGVQFVEIADEIAASRMSIEQLDYICRHQFDAASGLEPSTAEITEGVIATITAGVAALETELAAVAAQHSELRDQLLVHIEAVFANREHIIDWMRILDQTEPDLPDDQTLLESHVEAIGMNSDFVEGVLTGPSYPDYAIAIGAFLAHRRQRGQDALVDAALADATGLSAEAAGVLARTSALIEVGEQTVQARLVDSLTTTAMKVQAYQRVHKAALIISGLEIPAADLPWYFAFENDTDTPQALDLNALPLSSNPDGTEHLERWRRVALGQALQDAFNSAANPLPDIGAAGLTRQAVADLFVARTTWERDDVEYLLGSGFLDLPSPVNPPLRDPRLVARIRDVTDLVRRTGVRASVMATWARTSVPTAAIAAQARRALEARHAESAWPDVVIPLTNTLRERQRDALVAFIVQTNPSWGFADDIALFNALLVDPKMNACMTTSRIRLALSSVQLFIQRLLLGMEDAEIPAGLANDWTWMRTYRVWEANRSVFFWPENWAEPELRDDKTPFFRELEEQLAQGPLEDAQVERAFAEYLYKLHEVGHLDIVALYHEVLANNDGDRAHVLGRTRNLPTKHFYRRRVNNNVWTAWEQLPLEIETDQVVLVGHNRRLFVIWLQLRKESEERGENEDTTEPPDTFYRFQLSWSERRDGEDWLPARSTPISEAAARDKDAADLYLRTSASLNGELRIDVVVFQNDYVSNPVSVSYIYDDCRDTMEERAPAGDAYTSEEIGIFPGTERTALGQQQWAAAGPANPWFILTEYSGLTGNYDPKTLLHNPGPHRVMLSHPGGGVYFGVDDPATFDNGKQAFYITRRNVSLGHPAGIVEEPEPPSSLAYSLPPASDLVHLPVVWAGEVPGSSTMNAVDYGAVATSDTTTVLALAQQTVQTDVEIGLTGGGIHVPVELDETFVRGYLLETFYHPYTCLMRTELNRHGVEGLFVPTHEGLMRQGAIEENNALVFDGLVAEPRPVDDFDFGPTAAYGVYNWELFYHAPLYIAERLRREQRFEQAMRWYHFIFDPLARTAGPGDTGTERYWNVKPLYEEASGAVPNVDIVKYVFDQGFSQESELAKPVVDFIASIFAWITNPFSPHAIARWRPGTYRWVVLQRYLDNLIEWADSLFRRDTIETINEATQLYLLAAQILGARPRPLPAISPPVSTYDDLDAPAIFGGFAELEDFMPNPGAGFAFDGDDPAPPGPLWWYFCVPPNKKLLAYWDTVADRLYKIRNCQNIDGVKRALALFDPPIDPALLVKAKAAGLDLGAVIADLQSPLPHHRYRVLAARALELVGDVRALGSALQQALERKDAERLQELRATHEVALLKAVRQVRELQIEEAEENRTVLDRQMAAAVARFTYYRGLERRSGKEKASAEKFKTATRLMIASQVIKLLGGITVGFFPTNKVGTGYFLEFGGQTIGTGLSFVGDGLAMIGGLLRDQSSMLQVEAGYERRWEEWRFQERMAVEEQAQILQQQVAADIRTSITKKELENHDLQIQQSEGVEEFLRSRYTNEQLYNWLIGQISTLYFQSYKLAYDLAKKAERAMRYELGNDETYIEFGHWDSLRKGLLAGERLQLDLRRMEVAYLDKRRREYELSKRISLRMLDPSALLELQQTGTCEFAVPEVVFDLDHPGHYMRRIKAVSVTIPAITGPHVTLGATLTLLEDVVRLNTLMPAGYGLAPTASFHDDDRFRVGYGGVGSIATSSGQSDSGLFTLDFNDERLLPFEGSGAISRWRLQLPNLVRQFDYDTITDVELQIQYTARDGGQEFRGDVEDDLSMAIERVLVESNGFMLVMSAKEAFPEAWERFLYPVDSPPGPLEIPIVVDQLPYFMRRLEPNVFSVRMVFVPRDGATAPLGGPATLTAPGGGPEAFNFDGSGERSEDTVEFAETPISSEPWSFELGSLTITPDDLDNLFVVVHLMFDDPPEP